MSIAKMHASAARRASARRQQEIPAVFRVAAENLLAAFEAACDAPDVYRATMDGRLGYVVAPEGVLAPKRRKP